MYKRYPVAEARTHLAEVLDRAENGEGVVIERRGVRFYVTSEPAAKRTRRASPRVEILDSMIESGSWSWAWTPKRTKLRARRARLAKGS